MRYGPRILETTDTEGTGAYTLDGAAAGHLTFLNSIPGGAGTLVAYVVTDGSNWEEGFGTLSSGPATLTREGIFGSSNSGAAVNWGPGTKNIYCAPSTAVLTALVKGCKGPSRPAWLPAGGLWTDDSTTPWIRYQFDGTNDTELYRIDPTDNRAVFEGVKATAIASASSIDIGAATGDFLHITGTTPITALGTAAAGVERTLVFDGVLTLTHNATSLILFGGANIATTTGAVVRVRSEGSGNWRQVGGWRANGKPWAAIASADMPAATDAAQGAVRLATLLEVQTRTAPDRVPAVKELADAGVIGEVLLGTTALSGSGVNSPTLPAGLKGIRISIEGASWSTSATFEMVFSHDDGASFSSSGYDYQTNASAVPGASSFGFSDAVGAAATLNASIIVHGHGQTGVKMAEGFSKDSSGATRQFLGIYTGGSLAAVNKIRIRPNTGNWDGGQARWYGF